MRAGRLQRRPGPDGYELPAAPRDETRSASRRPPDTGSLRSGVGSHVAVCSGTGLCREPGPADAALDPLGTRRRRRPGWTGTARRRGLVGRLPHALRRGRAPRARSTGGRCRRDPGTGRALPTPPVQARLGLRAGPGRRNDLGRAQRAGSAFPPGALEAAGPGRTSPGWGAERRAPVPSLFPVLGGADGPPGAAR